MFASFYKTSDSNSKFSHAAKTDAYHQNCALKARKMVARCERAARAAPGTSLQGALKSLSGKWFFSNLRVLCASAVNLLAKTVHRRDAENAEDAQSSFSDKL
jgi:hypothetical protein